MRQADLSQIELLSRIDRLIERCACWPGTPVSWIPSTQGRLFLQRIIPRVLTVRERLETPLVVAMFGGTGTGKSSLVNALLGQEISRSGRQRPTTLQPQLLIHPSINLNLLQLPLEECQVHRPEIPLLEDLIIVDCPDPDTTEEVDEASNLERLRRFLPHCDVLIYTSTQQKYRSANVQQELRSAASGCKLVFVQTHADRDSDIRDDWKRHLSQEYEVPEMFFVDSLASLRHQQQGLPAEGEIARLQNFLLQQLASANRVRIRRDNVLDLLYASLSRVETQLQEKMPAVQQLQTELEQHTRKLQEQLSIRLQEELLSARQLWERRLLESVVKRWGSTPFAWLLRLHSSLGTLLGSLGLMRARTTAHVALLGLTQGVRLLRQRQQEQEFHSLVHELDEFVLPEGELAEKRLILNGYAREAGFETEKRLQAGASVKPVVGDAFQLEFFQDASREVDQAVETLATKNSSFLTRMIYDSLFVIFPLFLLGRIGKNFFWDSLFLGKPILTADFYIPAAIFLAFWCGLFLMFFTRRLRRGLKQEVNRLVRRILTKKFHHVLFPEFQQLCLTAEIQKNELQELVDECNALRQEQDSRSSLGAQRITQEVLS